MGNLPHYFLAECNLLETVADEERGIARQVIADILSDPLNALLTSPTDPQKIYGEVRPDDLVTAFRVVSSPPTSEQYQTFSELLARVDERRRQRYEEQLEEEAGYQVQVSGRPELTRLADMLKEMYIDGFVQEIRNPSALEKELVFLPSYIDPPIWHLVLHQQAGNEHFYFFSENDCHF